MTLSASIGLQTSSPSSSLSDVLYFNLELLKFADRQRLIQILLLCPEIICIT